MTRHELEEYFYESAISFWRRLKQSGEYLWYSINENKLIPKIYSEAGDLEVTLGDIGIPGPVSDEGKIKLIEERLPVLETLLEIAKNDQRILATPLYREIYEHAIMTMNNTKELYKILKTEL